ncbi:phosphoglycerate dehydrogenase [Candidatus Kaiserbacteria bacterium]|nr:phosphoglycerate dehydrogenase [Candidatus Kaiserbacteria bacterium]
MSRGTVVLLNTIHDRAQKMFDQNDYRVVLASTSALKGELHRELRDAVVLGIRSSNTVTEAMLEQMPNLLAIGAFCIGTNQIDIAACSKRGIAVFNDRHSSARSVAELALACMLNLSRGIGDHSKSMHDGIWNKRAKGAHEIRGKKLGIVGYGNIGTQLSVMAEGLGMQVYFYDVADKLALGNARKCASLVELLSTVDVVSMHIDGRGANKKIMGEQEFSLMNRDAYFINVSRGSVVDEIALAHALMSGRLGGVALDVFEKEPSGNEEFASPLRNMRNVILTPHIGGSTEEAQENIGAFVAEKLRAYLETGSTALSVNLPQVTMQEMHRQYRITHLHRNVPGVMANINALFAHSKINIEAQRLQTAGELGYAVIDLNQPCDASLLQALHDIPETIRLREIDRA